MLKKVKVRVFYRAWQDIELFVVGERDIKNMVDILDPEDATLEYDFYEVLEEENIV